MIQLRGNINIRTIDGRRGPFNVGALVTPLGEFKVKDACLDQFDEGRYSGEFIIERIYPATYYAATRLIVEVRAQLGGMALDEVDELEVPADVNAEPDPVDETPVAVSTPPAPEPETPEPEESEPDDDALRLQTLFSTLYPLGECVKLDPTVDRQRFRDQRNALKHLGYRFQFDDQVWTLPRAA
jgi:hypothetical protein